MNNIYNLTLSKLQDEMEALGQKRYRGIQLFTWLYEKRVNSFDLMSDISLKFIPILKEKYCFILPEIETKQISEDGTIKVLFKFNDNTMVESVLMRYEYGNVLCVSSQVGCNMNCAFCASGKLKKQRNLLPGEMVGQILKMEELMEGTRVSHVVVMGTGEPFDNYDNVIDFIKIINAQKGLSIGARHITVSTCGLPDKIIQYAKEGLQLNLAISLHAPNNELRNKIMPINKAYPLEILLPAIKEYETITSRRVTFEYIMLKDFNDSLEHADQLAALIKNTFAYVNLIPYNPIETDQFKRTSRNEIMRFGERLKKAGVNVTIRKEFGSDIDAACGQLRAKSIKAKSE